MSSVVLSTTEGKWQLTVKEASYKGRYLIEEQIKNTRLNQLKEICKALFYAIVYAVTATFYSSAWPLCVEAWNNSARVHTWNAEVDYHQFLQNKLIMKGGVNRFESILNELKKNEALILNAIVNDPSILLYIDSDLREKEEFIIKCMEKNGLALPFAPKRFIDVEKVVRAAVTKNHKAFEYVGVAFKKDPRFVIDLAKIYPSIFQFAHPTLKISKEVVREIALVKSSVLEHTELRKDEDFVKQFLEIDGFCFKYLSENLRDKEELLKLAVKTAPKAFLHASVRLQEEDEFFIAELIKINPEVFYYVKENSPNFNVRELGKLAGIKNISSLRNKTPEFRRSVERTIEAEKIRTKLELKMSANSRNSSSLPGETLTPFASRKGSMSTTPEERESPPTAEVKKTLNFENTPKPTPPPAPNFSNTEEVSFFINGEKNVKKKVLEIVKKDGRAYKHCLLLDDEDVIKAALSHKNKDITIDVVSRTERGFQHVKKPLNEDPDVIEASAIKSVHSLFHLPKEQKENKDLWLRLFANEKIDGEALKYADVSIQNDEQVAPLAVERSPAALFCVKDEKVQKKLIDLVKTKNKVTPIMWRKLEAKLN